MSPDWSKAQAQLQEQKAAELCLAGQGGTSALRLLERNFQVEVCVGLPGGTHLTTSADAAAAAGRQPKGWLRPAHCDIHKSASAVLYEPSAAALCMQSAESYRNVRLSEVQCSN